MFRLVLFLNFAFMTRKHFIVHYNLLIGKDMWTCHLPFVIGFCWSCHICDENFTLIWHFLCQNVYRMTDGEDWRGKREGKSTIYKCTIYKPDICRISVGIEPKYIYKAQTLKLFGQKWAKPQDQIWNNLKSSSSI